MLGHGISTELMPPYNSPQTNVAYWQNIRWVDLAPGFGTGDDFGPEVSFGHAVKAALPMDDIYLVKYAVSGSNLYNQWRPNTGSLHSLFLTKVNNALAKLDQAGVNYELSGMLWLQGEADAIASRGDEYQANLEEFIADMRTQFLKPDLLFMIARVRDFYVPAESALVRNAQVNTADSDPYVEWFDTDNFNPLRNGGHYATAAQLDIGREFASTYLNASGRHTEPITAEPSGHEVIPLGLESHHGSAIP